MGLEPPPLLCPIPPSLDPGLQLNEWAGAAPTEWLASQRRDCVDALLSVGGIQAGAWCLREMDASVVSSLPEAVMHQLVRRLDEEAVSVTALELPAGLIRLPSWVVSLERLQTLSLGPCGQFERLNLRGLPHLQQLSVGAGLQHKLVVHVRVGCDVKVDGNSCMRLRIYRHEGERIAAVQCTPYWSQPKAVNLNGQVQLDERQLLVCRHLAAIVMKLRAEYRLGKRDDPEDSWSLEDLGDPAELEALRTSDLSDVDGRCISSRMLNAADEIFFVHNERLGDFLHAQFHAMHQAGQKERYCPLVTGNHALLLCLTARDTDKEDAELGVRRMVATLYDPNITNDDCNMQASISVDDGTRVGEGFTDWTWRRLLDVRAPVSSTYLSHESIHFGNEQFITVGVYHTPESALEMLNREIHEPAVSFKFMPSESAFHPAMGNAFVRVGVASILLSMQSHAKGLPKEMEFELLWRRNFLNSLMRNGYATACVGYLNALRDAFGRGVLDEWNVKRLLGLSSSEGRSAYNWTLHRTSLQCAAAWIEGLTSLCQSGALTGDDAYELCMDLDAMGRPTHQRLLSANSGDAFLLHVHVAVSLHASGVLSPHHVAGLVAADLQDCELATREKYWSGLMSMLTSGASVERGLPESCFGHLMAFLPVLVQRRRVATVSVFMGLLHGFCEHRGIRGEQLRQLIPANVYAAALDSGECLQAIAQTFAGMVRGGLLQAVDVIELCLARQANGVPSFHVALQSGDRQAFLAHAITVVGLYRAGVLSWEDLLPLLGTQGLSMPADISDFYLQTVTSLLGDSQ